MLNILTCGILISTIVYAISSQITFTTLNIRLSYNDVRLFMSILNSLPQQALQAKNQSQPRNATKHSFPCKSLISILCPFQMYAMKSFSRYHGSHANNIRYTIFLWCLILKKEYCILKLHSPKKCIYIWHTRCCVCLLCWLLFQ